uniref:NB-ARC domain-containing protein n=1 Tax=Setaria italica TaxID=4555 RepID=K3ZMW1_SETIT
MADLAIGISRTAVQLLADKVRTAIKEEAEQWQIVQRDLVFITGEFEMMQSFLNVADAERVRNDVVWTWVRQVRDLSYDTEDCIEFVLQLDTKKRSWWLRLLPSCGKTEAALPVDEAVAKTTLLRARVVDVSQRNIRYNLIVDSGSRPINQQVQRAAASSKGSFDILTNAVKKTGPLDLPGLITREGEDLQVISVCGPEGDLGKVAIIRKLYGDSRIYKEFECRAWVKLMEPFNAHEFIRTLMIQFFAHSFCSQEQQEGSIKESAHKINTHRYLIVLEDLYTMAQLDTIRSYLPDMKKGSRIVVLTHQPVIASLCAGEPCRVFELVQFSPYHSVRVYFKEQIQEGRLISLWGMPGVGKSGLVWDIYCKWRTSNNSWKHAWASVSNPFNPTDFSRNLLLNLLPKSTSSEERYSKAHQAKDPIQECRHLLHEHVYLVIIDGLQFEEDWDWIKSNLIGSGGSRSCIITITSEESVGKHCAVSSNNAVVHNIKGLEADAALELFKKSRLRPNQTDLFILSKCGGLPKVIVTLARYLASRPSKDVLEQEMRRLSDNFMHELETNPEFDSLRGILAWMHSYLHACPRHLKKCMLYLSVFPQDRIIRRRRLVRRWIAEGYSKGTDSISMEKYAEKLFDEVAALSIDIMQPVLKATSKVIGYRVNGFFREYIISRPVEERVFFPVEVSALEKGHGQLTTEAIGQHLAVGDSWDNDRFVFEGLDFSRLRSLTMFILFKPWYVSDRMRVLRVLDLENAVDVWNSHFEAIGKLLPRLKFLSLRGQREVSRVPDSVGELMQLQTLDIRDTSIVALPPCITRLQKLQYIRAGTTIAFTQDDSLSSGEHSTPLSRRSNAMASRLLARFSRRGPDGSCRNGVEVPRGIARLKALQTLGAIHVNTAGDATFNEIDSLLSRDQLKKLELFRINRKTSIWNHWSSLHMAQHLESLSLQFEKSDHFVHWDYISLPRSLRSLKMHGHVEQVPPSIRDLGILVKLTLEKTTLFTTGEIKVIGSLPSLRTLRLRVNKDQDGELQFHSGLFSKLEVLEIACKWKLRVRFDIDAMEKLEQLKIHCLQGSEMQFSGLEHPVSLKQVWLMGSFDDALKVALGQQLVKHLKKPALKLEVEPRSSQESSEESN